MAVASAPAQTQRLASLALRRFAWAVLTYFIAVILWGGLVRATGSGAGCGDHWPLCNGTVIQHSARIDTMIEFTHRITSGLSFFLVVALLAWTFARTARGHLARVAAIAAVAFTVIEAALGAFLVKLGLTAQSRSPLRAPYLALHLTNTMLLLAALTLTAHLLSRRTGYLARKHPHCRAIRRDRIHYRCAHRWRDGIAGRAGRHTLPGKLVGRGTDTRLRSDEWMAGALALDAPDGRVRGQLPSHLAAGSRRAANDSLGQSRALRNRSDSFSGAVRPGCSRCGISRAGVAADCASARRGSVVGCACGSDGAANAGAGGGEIASQRVSGSARQRLGVVLSHPKRKMRV